MKLLHTITFVLLVVGGLNWGLEALGYNLVYMLLGTWPMLERLVYLVVGAAAVFEAFTHKSYCKHCDTALPQL